MINKKFKQINWKLFISTRKQLIIAIACFVFGLLVLALAAFPQFQKILNKTNDLEKLTQKLEKLERKITEIEQLKISEDFKQKDKVDEVLPSYKPLLELLTNLDAIAVENRILVADLKINPGLIATDAAQVDKDKKKAQNFDTLKLEMTASGELANVEKFLSSIEKISPFSTLTNIDLKRRTLEKTTNVLTSAEIELESYYFTQSIKATLEEPLPKITNKEKDAFQKIVDFIPDVLEEKREIEGGVEDLFGIEGLESFEGITD